MNLQYASNTTEQTVSWSEQLIGKQGAYKISSACANETLAILDTESQQIKNTEGGSIDISSAIYDAEYKNILAYVTDGEDTSSDLTVRSFEDGDVIFSATKAPLETSSECAEWTVSDFNNMANSTLDPTVLPYLLAWKVNGNLSCDTSSNSPSSSKLSPGAIYLITVGGVLSAVAYSVAAAVVASVIFRRYRANHLPQPAVLTVAAAAELALKDGVNGPFAGGESSLDLY